MTRDLIIGVDSGTSVVKAVAFDLDGHQLAVTSTPNRVSFGADGAAEQDLDRTWADLASTVRALADQVPGLAERTVALAATAQGDGTWLIDAAGRPTGPAMLWLDGRSGDVVMRMRASPGAALTAARTGTALNPSMQSSQLRWLHERGAERLARATTAFHCKDWLFFKATGERRTTLCEGIFTYGDYRSLAYDDAVVEALGLTTLRRLLPPMVDSARYHAPLSADAAAQTGLRAGTPVVLPPVDVPLTLIGGGALAGPGGARIGGSVLGSTGMHGWVVRALDEIVPSAEAGYTMVVGDDLRVRLMSHMAATLNLDWLLGLVGDAARLLGPAVPSNAQLLAQLNPMVLAAAPAQAVFHPYICESGERGPFVNPHARAQLSGVTSTLGLAGLARSVFEGIAFASRDCYASLGAMPDEIRLSGGAAKSAALRQLLATVTGVPVRVSHREECGAAGAALFAAVAVGLHGSVREALPTWSDPYLDASPTLPDPQQTALYDRLFPIYRDIAERAREPWAALAALRQPIT